MISQSFQIAQQLIHDICYLSVQYLDTDEVIQSFSETYMLHTLQSFLNPATLKRLCLTLAADKLYYIIDQFDIHFILFLIDEAPVVAGPFCPLIMTKQDCMKYISHHQLSPCSSNDLLSYRSQFPVISEENAIHIIRSLLHTLQPSSKDREMEYINLSNKPNLPEKQESDLSFRKNYSELIQERYQLEQRFMRDVENGNFHAAILNLRNMQRDVAFLKELGTTLESERIGAAIVRTMVRISAMRAGLPAAVIDLVSTQNTITTQNAKSVEEIFREKEKMVNAFCQEILSHKNHQYSNLVSNAMHYIEHHYSQNLTVRQLADELNVNINRLISVFQTETGRTPGNYIQNVRLTQASHLLSNTDLSVQTISTMVGIPDANYFIKLFKREYSMTPNQYRKFYRL